MILVSEAGRVAHLMDDSRRGAGLDAFTSVRVSDPDGGVTEFLVDDDSRDGTTEWLEGLLGRRLAQDEATWKEDDHPRDDSGQFSSGGSGSAGSKKSEFSTVHAFKNAGMEKAVAKAGYESSGTLKWTHPDTKVEIEARPGGYYAIRAPGHAVREGKGAAALERQLSWAERMAGREASRRSGNAFSEQTMNRVRDGVISFDEGAHRIIERVAEHLDHMHDRGKISVVDDSYQFTLKRDGDGGESQRSAMGTASLSNGTIKIYRGVAEKHPEALAPVLVHEIAHQQFQAVLNEWQKERAGIVAREREIGGDVTTVDGSGNVKIKKEYEAEFPLATVLEPLLGSRPAQKDLIETDGITDYSRDWWKAHGKSEATNMQAMHETIAEMARLDWEGTLHRLVWYKDSKTWRPLYEAVRDFYPEVVRKRGATT